jgi:SAM-dependent methyltransferase
MTNGSAAEQWRKDLESWAIPRPILEKAPESPYHFPVQLFASRADAASGQLTFSNERALDALPEGGTVLDVGCGAGAASLPLAFRASRLIGVDASSDMLEEFGKRVRRAGLEATTTEGSWPDVADRTSPADVVLCHHVAYNAPDLREFALRLTDHARVRVVMELTVTHPLSPTNELWLRFHRVIRPERPTADEAEAVLHEAGLPIHRQDWTAPRPGGFATRADLVASVRRQLCLPADRDPEIEEAIRHRVVERDGLFAFPDRPVATIWWTGTAGRRGPGTPGNVAGR